MFSTCQAKLRVFGMHRFPCVASHLMGRVIPLPPFCRLRHREVLPRIIQLASGGAELCIEAGWIQSCAYPLGYAVFCKGESICKVIFVCLYACGGQRSWKAPLMYFEDPPYS